MNRERIDSRSGAESPSSTINRSPKGIELGDLLILFARNKLVVAPKTPGADEHITMHLGPNSKVLDVHKTRRSADGLPEHQTLFEITHENLQRLLEELTVPLLQALMSTVRYLTPSDIVRRRYTAVVGPLPTRANLAGAIEMHRRRLTINDAKVASAYRVPRYLDELYELRDGEIFILISGRTRKEPHRVGFGFPVAGKRGRARLLWISDKALEKQMNHMGELLRMGATRLAVVPPAHGATQSRGR